MARKFERALDAATEQTLVEPNWEGILECVDMIRGRDVPVKDAIVLIQKRYHSSNPHIAHHALLVLEACVKNCGKKFHVEVATKEFMDDLKNLVIAGVPDKVKEKILELVQCWSSAFRDKPEYKIVVDTHNLLKMNGFEFPVLKEADAMFMADSAPDWMEGDNCYRCRTEFGVFTRRHHCRACGQIFCDKCSSKQMLLPQFGIEKKVRVCESCFDKRQSQRTSSAAGDASADSKTNLDEAARERARLQELMDKEAEELQLALAISQSEAEAKEKESRNLYSLYNGNGGSATNGAAKTNGATTSNGGVYDVYKGAATLTEEMTPIKMENEEQPMDSVLAKYLDRDYWERKRTNMKESDHQSNTPRATAPPPSELSYSISSNASQFQNETQNGCETPNTLGIAFDKMQLSKQQSSAAGVVASSSTTTTVNDDDEVAETSKFCSYLKEQVDTMENRMRSNLLRNRSIVNDSAIHSLFAQLTNFHSNVLSRMTKLEGDREYYESLQDHLAHIQEARQAVNALREEHKRQMEARLMEEQQQRRMQMQQKLEFMRQKKHEMLFYQRHMALQRFHEQEQQIQQRRMMAYPQPAMGGQQSLLQQQPSQQYYGMPTPLAVSSGPQQPLPPQHQWLPPPTVAGAAPLAYSNSNPALAGVGGGAEYNAVTSSASQYYQPVPQLQQVPPVSQHYVPQQQQQQTPMQSGVSVAGGYAPPPQMPMYGGTQPAVSQPQGYAPPQSQHQYVAPTQQQYVDPTQMYGYAPQHPQSDLNYQQQQPPVPLQQNLQSAGNSSASGNVPEDLLISFD